MLAVTAQLPDLVNLITRRLLLLYDARFFDPRGVDYGRSAAPALAYLAERNFDLGHLQAWILFVPNL